MRAYNFLTEYRQDITLQRFAAKLAEKIKTDRTNPYHNWGKWDDGSKLPALLRMLESADPTPNKQYVPWIVSRYVNDTFPFEDVMGQVPAYLEKFHKLNQRKMLPAPRNDINRYANFGDFMSVMDEYDDPDQKELTDKGQATELYNDDQLRVIMPKDQAAACYYGQGTRWCTAATKGSNYFNDYNEQFPLLIVIPKHPKYPGEKYQLWFGWVLGDDIPIYDSYQWDEVYLHYGEDWIINHTMEGQFKNEQDHDVGLKQLINRFGQSILDAITQYEYQFPAGRWAVRANFDHAGIR